METLFIGKNIIFLPETDSTNSYAIHLLKDVNLAEGTVIQTAKQTKGKGQRGTTWNTEPDSNLTVSVILKPVFLELKNQFFLYQILALACYDTLAELIGNSQFDIKIKWPNDILVNKRKIAGILIENGVHKDKISWSVAGVGININQEHFAGSPNATSLKTTAGRSFEVKDVLDSFCRHLEKYYLDLKNQKFEFIKNRYLSYFFGLNFYLTFEIKGVVQTVLVRGISRAGLLLLADKDGKEIEVDVKDVKWLF